MRDTKSYNRLRRAAVDFWGGPIQTQHTLAPGVLAVSTPGHGGIVVDPAVFPLHPGLREGGSMHNVLRWTWQGGMAHGAEAYRIVGFEEDCEWALLLAIHPELCAPAFKRGYFGLEVDQAYALGHMWPSDRAIYDAALALA